MTNYRRLNFNIIILKTLMYRLLSFGIMASFVYSLTRDIKQSLQVSLMLEGAKVCIYFVYECIFDKKFKMSKDEGCVIWFTGLPCSGKSTIADKVAEHMEKLNRRYERLDGDVVRLGLSSDLGFSQKDRDENIKRVTFVSKLLSRNGTVVLASFVSPFRKTRFTISENVTNFIEVYVFADKKECASRDVKGMWAKAKDGKIKGFTGFDAPYESPHKANVVCITEKETVEESAQKVIDYMKTRKLI